MDNDFARRILLAGDINAQRQPEAEQLDLRQGVASQAGSCQTRGAPGQGHGQQQLVGQVWVNRALIVHKSQQFGNRPLGHRFRRQSAPAQAGGAGLRHPEDDAGARARAALPDGVDLRRRSRAR